ncbi:histidine kinase [Cellulomonas chitinilytica]|uniref:histidine kinase n=1 Tax=Cellulomonas chitinilytica TaxID=398759 RepID=A0A919P3S2_9CELL|nr:sensor histidine kinase [Cellulomonas chitinilytica]GIG21373.1 histidine kinase [Cellulomonas chitinilytica]
MSFDDSVPTTTPLPVPAGTPATADAPTRVLGPTGPAPTGPAPTAPAPAPRAVTTDDDLRVVAPAFANLRELAWAPVSGATWRAVSQVVVGSFGLLVMAIWLSVALSLAAGLLVVFLVGLPILVFTLWSTRPYARLERARLKAQVLVDVPAPPYRRPKGPGWWPSWVAIMADARTWGHVAYVIVAGLLMTVTTALLSVLGSFGLALVVYPLLVAVLPDTRLPAPWPLLVVGGVVAVWLAALAAQVSTLLQVRLARSMLGASPQDLAVLAAQERAARAEGRAEHLAETRTAAVGAADDERRRIERDLHDGAQQRLVALGVELGVARRTATADPDAAAAALDHAHREVKETLAELRDLVRGIHPAVLTDRGLDAALSALAARSPVPVEVVVPNATLLGTASTSAQAAAYFVAAEALTNAAKHAHAQHVRVEAAVTDGRLRLVVQDDGVGGADAHPGSGLDGLRSRVAALDGTFHLESPAGAGTRLTVEVPCAS